MSSRLTNYSMKRTLRYVGSVILLLAATFFIALVLIRAFTIRDIVVDAPGMTIELDKQKFGKNLLFLPTGKLRQELLDAYPLLGEVTFERKFPGTLTVHLTKRSAYVFLQSNGNNYELDEQGLVLGPVDSTAGKTTMFFDIGILPAGSRVVDGRVGAALSFMRPLKNPSLITRIEPRDSQSIQAKLGNTNIFLPQNGDLSAKADTLQIIMEGFRMKGTLPTVIDLRFDKPVITN